MRRLIKESRSIFEKNNTYSKLEKINLQILEPNFWKNKNKAEQILKEKKIFENLINSYESSIKDCKDYIELYNLAYEENNKVIINDSNYQ